MSHLPRTPTFNRLKTQPSLRAELSWAMAFDSESAIHLSKNAANNNLGLSLERVVKGNETDGARRCVHCSVK